MPFATAAGLGAGLPSTCDVEVAGATNVYVANEPARAFYTAAGYEELARNDRQVHLRKRLLARPTAD
jgi:hypothetical protein